MIDPRELGLPPADRAPSFSPTPDALNEVRRRHTRRRQRRMTAAGGGGLAAVVVIAALALNSSAINGGLEQQQPARSGTQSSAGPSPKPQAQASPTAGTTVPSPDAGTSRPGPSAAPRGVPPAGPTGQMQTQGPTAAAASDSTPVRRDRTALGNDLCRLPLSWGTSGWCFVAPPVSDLTAGRTVTLSVSLCRNDSRPGQVRFPDRQQASWNVSQGRKRFWNSSQQPSAFTAGELVTLQPNECLRWRTDWHVTTQGRPMPSGDYLLQWNTGADLRSPRDDRGYHDDYNIHVAASSTPNGIGPQLPHQPALTRVP